MLMHPDMYNTLLTIAIEEPEKRGRNEKVWAGLSTLNSELLKPMLNPEDPAERLAKSGVVQDKATAFVRAFTDVCGVETATLYCHQAVTHLPEMVRDTEVDMSEVSQQALEHALKQVSRNALSFLLFAAEEENTVLFRSPQCTEREVPLVSPILVHVPY